jgi:hypothetical protein
MKRQTCKEANQAFILAVVGSVAFGLILEPIALARAIRAHQILAKNPALSGSAKATATMILASVLLAVSVMALLLRIG